MTNAELDNKGIELANDLLSEAGERISIENAIMAIRIAFKAGYSERLKEALYVLTEDKG